MAAAGVSVAAAAGAAGVSVAAGAAGVSVAAGAAGVSVAAGATGVGVEVSPPQAASKGIRITARAISQVMRDLNRDVVFLLLWSVRFQELLIRSY
jgi:hypothetical protein